jgi:hypothetical protein
VRLGPVSALAAPSDICIRQCGLSRRRCSLGETGPYDPIGVTRQKDSNPVEPIKKRSRLSCAVPRWEGGKASAWAPTSGAHV